MSSATVRHHTLVLVVSSVLLDTIVFLEEVTLGLAYLVIATDTPAVVILTQESVSTVRITPTEIIANFVMRVIGGMPPQDHPIPVCLVLALTRSLEITLPSRVPLLPMERRSLANVSLATLEIGASVVRLDFSESPLVLAVLANLAAVTETII